MIVTKALNIVPPRTTLFEVTELKDDTNVVMTRKYRGDDSTSYTTRSLRVSRHRTDGI